MKITQISTYSPEEFGGLETVVRELSKRFSENHSMETFYRGEQEKVDYTELKPIKNFPSIFGHMYYNWKLSRMDFSGELIHAHGQNGLGPGISGTDKPVVLTFHGTYAGLEKVRNKWRTVPIWNPLKKFEEIGAKKADVLVTCSNQVKQEAIDFYGVDEEKIEVIHNGVDTDHYRPIDQEEAKEELGLNKDQRYVSWIGATEKRKGMDKAVEIAEKLDCKVLIAGKDGEDTENKKYLGFVDEEKLPHFYNASEAFVFPTEYEGHPLVVLEALAAHTPVITTEASNVEIGEKGEHYVFLEETDLSEIPEFLEREKDFSFIQEYDWGKVAERYEEVFEKLIYN